MKRLKLWFIQGVSLQASIPALLALVFFTRMLTWSGVRFMRVYFPDVMLSSRTVNYVTDFQTLGLQDIAFRSFVATPLREDLIHRLLPFGVMWAVWWLVSGKTPPVLAALLLALVTSFLFSQTHGGIGNVIIQGTLGMSLTFALLKWSAYGKKPLLGALAALVLHGTYNLLIALEILYRTR